MSAASEAARKKATATAALKAARAQSAGARQRALTPFGQARMDFRKIYGGGLREIDSVARQEFRFKAVRPDVGSIWIDRLVTSCTWTEDGGLLLNNPAYQTGSISLSKPPPDQRGAELHLRDGHEIECYVRWGDPNARSAGDISDPGFILLWSMRIDKPAIEISSGAWSFELVDDLAFLGRSTDDWHFASGKHVHTKGWRTDEILKHVCARYKVPLVSPRAGGFGHTFVKHKVFIGKSPLEVIRWAIQHEATATGRQFIMRWDRGKLHVFQQKRNPLLYTFHDLLTAATVEHGRKVIFSSFTARATAKHAKGSKAKTEKLKVRYTDRRLVKEYGLIHRQVSYKQANSDADLLAKGKRTMARSLEHIVSLTFTHPGIAVVRRGDAINVEIPEEGITGIRKGGTGVAFVQGITHNLTSNSYFMDVTCSFKDPLDPDVIQALVDSEKRSTKAAARATAKGKK